MHYVFLLRNKGGLPNALECAIVGGAQNNEKCIT